MGKMTKLRRLTVSKSAVEIDLIGLNQRDLFIVIYAIAELKHIQILCIFLVGFVNQ